MAKVVFGNIEKLDFRTTLEQVQVVNTVDEIVDDNEGKIYLLANHDEHVQAAINAQHDVYVPASTCTTAQQHPNVHVYFDLETYPFFQQAKELIRKEAKPQGVLRFKRTLGGSVDEASIAEDLSVFTSLL